MTRTISVTLPEDILDRLNELVKKRGERERSKLILSALRFYFELQGPDQGVSSRWSAAYAKASRQESADAGKWGRAQSQALGWP
ncbi:MAG: ribbon-helix-helix protein, CopG family [Elusimicrobia bacterium]|nr:ribbon-helix-helix protein, CopG family [Elusimicrobiota bacterium]